ncbi:sigma 54-interacting transcriptional regulator [Enterocloster bolteae]|uniref:sigma 54-interacting transcriptional regulator n=1 Tax=Clostridia TaxID=186801 RepID=UPI00189D6CC9|nr:MULTISPECIES: sigma 54-interacting transcriptional regulator [Clostridia]MCB7089098.1 sigma 54-interacting transcriptional regulator [Enterocloster bolteae]MCH1934162.1 sigma 54-interacting transcriptional regulator [Enterocloster sp. OA11]
MDRSQPKYHVLIVSINSNIRLEFQSYLHKILGAHIAFDTIGLDQVQRPEQIKGYQCILFSSPLVQSEFPIPIPKEVMQIVCTRTFNHACLDQIIRIPPGERVYIVNDTYDSIVTIMEQLKEAGVVQYRFEPFYPGCILADESIHYAITVGEPQLVPGHITNVIDIGNRIIDISTVNELCEYFHLPASLSNQITKSYVNSIMQIAKLTSAYYQDYIYSRQLLQTVISNLPIGLCLLSVRGEINMVNRRFSMDLELPETGTTGRNLSQFLPQPCKGMDFCHSADYKVMNRSGKHLLLSSLELLLPNHEPLYLLTSTPCPVLADGTTEYPAAPEPVFSDSRYTDSMFTSFTTASEPMKHILEYARRLSLYDFPVLIQGESGTQKKLLARAIHRTSSRRQQPFVCLNMPMGLNVAARVNGIPGVHEASGAAGAALIVSDPLSQMLELFKEANHGTLLIDSAEYLSPEIQGLLIHILQDNRTGNVFGTRFSPFDVRIIATAGQDLYEMVRQGLFREELFFLLNAASIDTLPLRKRREDIPLLMDQFFRELFHNKSLMARDILSSSLFDFLMNYDYPGNVQELYNLTRYFFSHYAAHPLILAQLPSYIRNQMRKPGQDHSPVRLRVLAAIAASPRIGRGAIKNALAEAGAELSDGRLRGLLKELSEEGLIRINRTRGGCEITEQGLMSLRH